MKKLFRYAALLLCSSLMIAVAACAPQTTTVQTKTLSFHTTVQLIHTPLGLADLFWNAATQVLTVHVIVTGLAPNSIHPEHIHVGSCSSTPMGAVLYTLTPLQANAHGVALSATTIKGITGGIPANKWSVNIHNGPTLGTPLEAMPIACGTISTVNVSLASNLQARALLLAITAPDEDVQGTAQMAWKQNTLTVSLALSGLIPHTLHMVQIHAGSCASQGPVVYALQPVVADAQGHATATTIIRNVTTFTGSGEYINVHEAGTTAAMRTSQGFDPIACGNIGEA